MTDHETYLRRLTDRVPPPREAVNGTGDWAAAERALGTALPADYKRLVETYGRGDFCGELCLSTPFDGADNPVRLEGDALDVFGSMRDTWPEKYPYPLYPEPGGLLAWGVTEAAGQLCWLTEGPPETWPVVIWSRDDDHEKYECGAAAFLDGWLDGRITSEILEVADDVPPYFDPAVEHDHVYVRLDDPEDPETPPYDERLQILRAALGPTADRGAYEHQGARQDHFAVTETGWQLTYEMAYGHQIRIAFPPADSARARTAVLEAVARMGCVAREANTVHGTSTWELPTDGELTPGR
ncbi:SMI1/KNR4 family protein [Streptomyces sp. NPDC048172]|uniref:SMI1/KNR4 family protein n=1 Tax=Streptomyces sp. NPDC048172 TaxID=3365505 RepID=UPI00372000CE